MEHAFVCAKKSTHSHSAMCGNLAKEPRCFQCVNGELHVRSLHLVILSPGNDALHSCLAIRSACPELNSRHDSRPDIRSVNLHAGCS